MKHTKDSLSVVRFSQKYDGWHSYQYKKDQRTIKAVERAYQMGEIEINRDTNQFKAKA
jgi:hypothetical protein